MFVVLCEVIEQKILRDAITKKLKKGEMVWKRKEDVTVCKWKDKRDVLTNSNMHRVEMVEVKNHNGKS